MAQNNPITSRETLKQYALRALGKPVIEINVEAVSYTHLRAHET